MLVYVVRHGESEDDLTDSYGGAANFRLTDRGRAQAEATGLKLRERGIQGIYASPLARAAESAEIISRQLGMVPVETVAGLRERNTYGVLSGHTPERARELFGYILDELDFKPGSGRQCMPGGEEYGPFIDRVRGAFQHVVRTAEASGYGTVAVVTHGKFTLGLFTEVLCVGDQYDKDHGSINVVEYVHPRLVVE